MNRRTRIAALSSTAAILLGCLAVGGAGTSSAAQGCQVFQVRSPWPGAASRFLRVSLPSGAATTIGTLHREINAIGYSASQGLVYGIGDNGDVIAVDSAGHDTDLGPARTAHGHPHRLWDANAGTVVGNDLYVESDDELYTVDIGTGADRLRITASTDLWPDWPDWLVDPADDFDYDPATGNLYGIADTDLWRAVVVRISPSSGRVTTVGSSPDLPAGEYGSVTVEPDRTLDAMVNDLHGRAVRYRIPPAGGAPTATDAGPAVADSDTTGCLPAVIPPPTTPPPPPTGPTVPPPGTRPPHPAPVPVPPRTAPTTVPTRVSTTVPSPTTPQPTSAPQSVPPLPPPARTTGPRPAAAPQGQPASVAAEVARQRRWGLTLLVLIIGGSLAASRIRTRRR